MSGERVLRIQPGETAADYTRRLIDTAPPLTPDLAVRLRAILPVTPGRGPAAGRGIPPLSTAA